ncbi:MAG: GNAT family N-acetyltransferase, partial [Candidatus Aenigmatarchaeota archaeon]
MEQEKMSKVIIRKAVLTDVEKIKVLLDFYAAKGLLLARSIPQIHEKIRNYYVAEVNDELVGCCCFVIYYPFISEIRSLAVKETSVHKGIGSILVNTCINDAKNLGIKQVFTLTYVPEFFKAIGFKRIPKRKM